MGEPRRINHSWPLLLMGYGMYRNKENDTQ